MGSQSFSLGENPAVRRNHVSQWLAGGTTLAGSLAAAGTASAEIVQITLPGNEVYANVHVLTDNTYDDLTGDGIGDLGGSNSFYFVPSGKRGVRGRVANNILRVDHVSSTTRSIYYNVRVGYLTSSTKIDPASVRNFVPVRFTDASINGGVPTEGLLEVLGENINRFEHRIQLVRLVFDDANPSRPEVKLGQVFPEWNSPMSLNSPSKAVSDKLERKIAALERKLRQIKARNRNNSPRLNFYRMPANVVRQIAELEKQIAGLKRKLAPSRATPF